LIGKPEEKEQLERSRRRWEDSIRIGVRNIGCEDVDWIHVPQDRDQWRLWIFRCHKMPGISCLAERLLASEEGLYSIQLVRGNG